LTAREVVLPGRETSGNVGGGNESGVADSGALLLLELAGRGSGVGLSGAGTDGALDDENADADDDDDEDEAVAREDELLPTTAGLRDRQ